MYGQGYPRFPPPPPPPPVRSQGLSPLVVVLIVVAVVGVLGAGACVVLGALVSAGASAETDRTTSGGAAPVAPTGTGAATGAATGAPGPGGPASGAEDDPPADGDPSAGATASAATSTAAPAATGGARWSCNATGWVRVCGFANVCNNQMVFGVGVGNDRFMAMTMAKNACENMARAKGGSTVCTVACTVR